MINKGTVLLIFTLSAGLALAASGSLPAGPAPEGERITRSVDDHWKFLGHGTAGAFSAGFDDRDWKTVNLPHTWNATDPFDDDGTYRRGIGWYRKKLRLDGRFRDKEVFLCFEGANQVADVYVNGAFVGEHRGGYTAFTFDITAFLEWKGGTSDNMVAVQVNNAQNPFIPPLDVGYALYGGIYRDVWLIATGKVHFSAVNDNSGGVYLSTPSVSAASATVAAGTAVTNQTAASVRLRFINVVYDAKGAKVAAAATEAAVPAGGRTSIRSRPVEVSHPHLWSPEHPYLYKVTSLVVAGNDTLDEVSNSVGFRWFSFDSRRGFSLNGHKYILRGTTRHQDMQGKGSALSAEDNARDMRMIKQMGCNFIRMAHYPQAPQLLRLADKLGLLIWEEVPVVDYMTIAPQFLDNAETMIGEMIRQNYNHPSVVIWGSMNEVLLYSSGGKRIPHHTRDTAYVHAVRRFAVKLDSTVRAEDTTRYTAMAMHLSDDYARYGLDRISQVAGHNIYDGWYGGKVSDFGKHLDEIHRREPSQVIFVSEYGAGSDTRVNSSHPERMDYTGEYMRYFHEAYLRQIRQRPYLAGTCIWNEFDFSQPDIGGTIPNVNQKGMVSWDRKPKDVYYLYKANWNPQPMVYIASRDWQTRAGEADSLSLIEVYSNLARVTLFLDGRSLGARQPDDVDKCSWKVRLRPGVNSLTASASGKGVSRRDHLDILYRVYPADLSDDTAFESLAVNVGSRAQYLDEAGTIWVSDRPYRKGSFGYSGGEPEIFNRKEVIRGTADAPLYSSYREGLQSYKLDVPDGQYKVSLYFAESDTLQAGGRVFDVRINARPVIAGLDLTAAYGLARAVKRTFRVRAVRGGGIDVDFRALKGRSVLSGIKVERWDG